MSKQAACDMKVRLEVQPLIRKGMQFRKPREFKVTLRAELFEFLDEVCELPEFSCAPVILVRGILEDFYDKYKHLIPCDPADQGVIGDE